MLAEPMNMKTVRATAVTTDTYIRACPLSRRGKTVRATGMRNGTNADGPTVSVRVKYLLCSIPPVVSLASVYMGTSKASVARNVAADSIFHANKPLFEEIASEPWLVKMCIMASSVENCNRGSQVVV